MTPQLRAATRDRESGPAFRAALRRMGADGWLTPGWPREYGGRGLDPLAQKIILEELWLAEAPFPFVTVNTIGPTLIRRGSCGAKARAAAAHRPRGTQLRHRLQRGAGGH